MEEMLNAVSVPAIVSVVYFIAEIIKHVTKNSENVLRLLPVIAAVLGAVCGLVCFFAIPQIMPADNVIVALVFGAASGLTATGFNQIIKQARK